MIRSKIVTQRGLYFHSNTHFTTFTFTINVGSHGLPAPRLQWVGPPCALSHKDAELARKHIYRQRAGGGCGCTAPRRSIVAAVVTGHLLNLRKKKKLFSLFRLNGRETKAVGVARAFCGERVSTGVLLGPATGRCASLFCLSLDFPCLRPHALSDDEDEEEDDDEIDVVSVDNRPKRGRPPSRRTPVTITVSADPFGPCPKRFHVSLHRQQHNYAAPSPDTDPEDDDFDEVESTSKRPRLEPPSPLSSPATSDSEDSNEQRRNFLERKRRDDLRSRFQALREEIPGLSGSSKTSKVAILTQATDYLLKLHASQRRQAQEKRKLKAKQQQLLRRISVLQNS
nr:protein L-Myc-1a isoform X2 [Misgurnus anguillicaudatus]